MSQQWNWAGNYAYQATKVRHPRSVAELQQRVAEAEKIRALGSRHSFNDLADSTGELISLRQLPRVIEVDHENSTVRVDGGITYGELAPVLEAKGVALANLASLPHISVAGACATATHGSGDRNQNLAAAVAGLEIVSSSGELIVAQRGDADFAALPVNLGALGVVSALTLDLEKSFQAATQVFVGLPWATLIERFDEITGSGYSLSIAPDWLADGTATIFVKQRVSAESPLLVEFFGATAATCPVPISPGADPIACTEQLGLAGPWFERLPHFKLEFEPSTGAELQTEYLIAREFAPAALQALKVHAEALGRFAQSTEVRSVAADDLWLSSTYQSDRLAVHFTWFKDQPAVEALLPEIERTLAPYGARPHWGKLFAMSAPQLRELYPRLDDFADLVRKHDPEGKFDNAFLVRTIHG